MAVWSEVVLSQLTRDFRMDAEYHKPEYLRLDALLDDPRVFEWGKLGGEFITGPFGSEFIVEKYVENSPYRYIRGKDVKPFFLTDIDNVYMPQNDFVRLRKHTVVAGDLLVSVVGTLGNVSLVSEESAPAVFSCKSTAYRTDSLNKFYLCAYLNSAIGQSYLQRKPRGSVQTGLNLDDLRTIPIYVPDTQVQIQIGEFVAASWETLNQSAGLYTEAESLLLHALGLDALDASHELTYERNFGEVAAAGRFDAAFFHPRHQRAMAIMARSGQTLGDVAPLAKRPFAPRQGEPFRYIEIGDLSENGHAEAETVMGEEAPSRAQWIVRPGDVITSTVRPIRRLSALIEPEQDGYVCSSGFAVLTPRLIEPELLTVYLRAPIVCEILDLHTTATMYPAIATDVLLKIPVTRPNDDVAAEIVAKVRAARQARDDAKRLLDEAKRRVEEMILGSEGNVPIEVGPRDGTNDPWDDQNERRVSLIQKRHRHGLTSDEQKELDGLQSEMSARINAVRPLPFDTLEKLERYVDEAERRLSDKAR